MQPVFQTNGRILPYAKIMRRSSVHDESDKIIARICSRKSIDIALTMVKAP